MPSFTGFKTNQGRPTPLPGQFFTDLLPEIDHLGELKVTLYTLWRMERMEGSFRCLQRSDFAGDKRFMLGMGATRAAAQVGLDEALERAVVRGTLLRVELQWHGGETSYYFLNSPKGQAGVDAIRQGKWRPANGLPEAIALDMERPNIFKLYEDHIGPLTPMLAEALQEAEETYPDEWIEDAIRISVENNKRSWKYAEAILRRWQEGGRDEQNRRDSEKDRRRYAEWEEPNR